MVRGRGRTLMMYLLTAVFSFCLGLFLLDQVILPRLTGGQEEVEVPGVEGLSLQAARTACLDKGLILAVQGETYQASIPPSHVMKQEPEAGAKVKQGRQVYVLVSLGPEMVAVPHVRNLTQRQAEILVERSRLKISAVERKSNAEVPRGRVIDIFPGEGGSLPLGAEVQLTVSDGVEQVRVPSVIDKPIEEATQILSEAGLKVGAVSHRINRYIPAGHVIDQAPLERDEVNIGTAVDLVVSGEQP